MPKKTHPFLTFASACLCLAAIGYSQPSNFEDTRVAPLSSGPASSAGPAALFFDAALQQPSSPNVQRSGRILAGPAVGLSLKASGTRRFTLFRIVLPVAASVQVQVLDARGQARRTLFQGQLGPGTHAFPYDGRGDRGRQLPGGIYFCRFQANGEVRTIPTALVP